MRLGLSFGSLRSEGGLLALVLVLATLLRLSGLDWGVSSLEGFTHDGQALSVNRAGFNGDADALYGATESLNDGYIPRVEYESRLYLFNSYGTVYVYLNRVFASVGATLLGFEPFGSSVRDGNLSRISGRWVSAVGGVCLVLVTWYLGKLLFGGRGALFAALLAALLPMSVQGAHLATVDSLLGLWFGFALLFTLRVLKSGQRLDYVLSGICIGLATATKINGLFLFLPLTLSHLMRQQHGYSLESLNQALRSPNIYLTGVVAVLTWVVLTPAAILESADYFTPVVTTPYHLVHSFRKASEAAASHRGWLHLEGASTYLYHPFHVFPTGLGWVVQISAIVGVVLAVWKRSPATLVVALSMVVYYLAIARLPDKPIRFFVPMAAFITVLATFPIVQPLEQFPTRIFWVIAGLLLLEPGAKAVALISTYDKVDARVAAAEWIKINIPIGGKLMLERGHNSLASMVSRNQVSLLMADLEHEFANAKGDQVSTEGHYTAVLESEFLSQVDYFALSDERLALKRVRKSAADFYSRLFVGELGFELVASFSGRPRWLGVAWESDETDLNWSRYDHPSTYIFKRVSEEPLLYTEHPELSIYRLRAWEHTREVIQRSRRGKNFTFFKRCLPAKFKERAGESALARKFMAFLKDPSTLTGKANQLTAIREGKAWRIKME